MDCIELMDIELRRAAEAATGFMPATEGLALFEAAARYVGLGPVLEVGSPEAPVAADKTALIRLHYVEGMDRQSCPAIVCCGGRMDFHGAPLSRT